MKETKFYKTLNISLQSKRYTIVQDIINSWDNNLTKSEVVCEDILAMYKIKQIPCLKDIVNLIINKCEHLTNINDNEYFLSLNKSIINYFQDKYSKNPEIAITKETNELNNYKKLLSLLIEYDPALAINLIKKLDS